ncbi:MAG: ATP-binding cassette, subfamily er 3 [Candidatus Binatota bacterium]|nr:ATP-binding cassette, subfamily er 3 [Candidatus Binatota bacterium]
MMLSLVGVSKAYGAQTVLRDVDWAVGAGERVGLAGANGAGKSTLMRIVAGGVEPDRGAVCLNKGATVGYLPQEIVGMRGTTVRTSALAAFDEIHALERRCRELEHALESAESSSPEAVRLLEEYAAAREEWDHRGSYDLESRAEEVLHGLGFATADFERDVGEFSGGWQMRIALARLLLQRPDVLLLDEPTNHLDLEARNWLEEFLGTYPGAVVLVAHDRYFLDVTVNRIAEVENGRLTDYFCNFSTYEIQKAERLEQARRAYEVQQEEIERTENFIRKFRYQASKAKLVQSRVKQLEKLERLEPPPGTRKSFRLRLPSADRSGRIVLELAGATKRYGDLAVYERVDVAVERGERIALVGPNGAGKTTLVKLLAGVEPLTSGDRRLGHKVALGYFAQDQATILDPAKTVLEEMTAAAPYEMVPHLRDLLGTFLFSGDAVHKRTHVLSGGERNRLALARLLLHAANCLLLDEPTNHLDIHAKDVLLEALQNYEGTIVLVSHDRYVLDQLPQCIVEVGHGRATRYLGNYEEYLAKKAEEEAIRARATAAPPPAVVREKPRNDAPKQVPPKSKKPRIDPARLTEDIARIEEEQARLTEELSRPDFYLTHADPHGLIARYGELKQQIADMYERLDRALTDSS